MACFIAPLVEGLIISALRKSVNKKERAIELKLPEKQRGDKTVEKDIPFSVKLGWLTNMLYGGSFLLAIEHIWHGEVVPWPLFLTAMNDPAAIGPMLMEIATVGVAMAALISAVWGIMLFIYYKKHSAVKAHVKSGRA